MMSFVRHITNRMGIKKEARNQTSFHSIGLGYSLWSCSPAELHYASPNNVKLKKSTVHFTIPR